MQDLLNEQVMQAHTAGVVLSMMCLASQASYQHAKVLS
jgi:hypothetical protein